MQYFIMKELVCQVVT